METDLNDGARVDMATPVWIEYYRSCLLCGGAPPFNCEWMIKRI